MAAALGAAEGGGIFFPNPQVGGIFKIFPARGVYPPTPYSRPLVITKSGLDVQTLIEICIELYCKSLAMFSTPKLELGIIRIYGQFDIFNINC